MELKKITKIALVVILTFNMLLQKEQVFGAVQFDQGTQYKAGGYQSQAVQPTTVNWTRQSQFGGSSGGKKAWVLDTEDVIRSSPAIGSDGTIYFCSSIYLYAVNHDGTVKWKFTMAGTSNLSPVIDADGVIYIGTSDSTGKIYAVNPDGITTKWICSINATLTSSPVIAADGTIYIGAGDGKLYGVSTAGVASTKYNTGVTDNRITSPAIDENMNLYFGGSNKVFYAVASNGTEKWERITDDAIICPPVISADGCVCVRSNRAYEYDYNGNLRCLIGAVGGEINASPVLGKNNDFYFGSNKVIYGIDRISGANIMPTGIGPLGGDVNSTAAMASDGTLYVGCDDGKLYSLNTTNGNINWRYQTGGAIKSSPIIGSDGTIYFGSDDKKFYAITAPYFMQQPVSETVYGGQSVTLSVVAAGSGTLSYQWKRNGSNIANATGASINILNAQASDAGVYTCYVSNVIGNITSSSATLTVTPPAPSATTNIATDITSTGATLNGKINANSASTAVTFEYGLTSNYGNTVQADESPVIGNSDTLVNKAITGLSPNTTYHYRVKGINSTGTTYGSDQTFTTLAPNSLLALGDSISYGMSVTPGNGYVDLLYNHLVTLPAYNNLCINNLSVSGYTSSALLLKLQDPAYIAAIRNAKVITVSVGGDNLLSPVIAAVCTGFGVNPSSPTFINDLAAAMASNPNKNTILASIVSSTTLANGLQAGVAQFAGDLPQIIGAIRANSPQSQIYILNLYNPFVSTDPLYALFDPLIKAINTNIEMFKNNGGYKVADVYNKFKATTGAVNFNLSAIQLDPHPTTVGHIAIYQAILDAEAGQAYYEVNIGTLTGGSITATPTTTTSGSAISLTITPDAGKQLQAGSLKYNDGSDHLITGTSFTMPGANVTISAVFENVPSTNTTGSSSSSSRSTAPNTVTNTIQANLIDEKTGKSVESIPAQVTTEADGTKTVTMKASDAIVMQAPSGNRNSLTDLSKIGFSTQTSSAGTGSMSITMSADGTIEVKGLASNTETQFNITYDLGKGKTCIIGYIKVKVDDNGIVSSTVELIDPYGIITDEATGKAITGVNVTLYYANTARNKAAGKTPDTVVPLSGITGFEPNDNKNPQISDATGAYGFMVFPTSDYYVVGTKDGYIKYVSPTISVEQEIVKWNFAMHSNGSERLAGNSRIDTSLAIAKATYQNTLSNVILATSENYADALSGSVLAYKLNAPILLVGTSSQDQAKVLDYLKTNFDSAGKVYILGGTGVISTDMEAKVTALGFKNIIRIGGADRYETAVKIADTVGIKEGTPVVLVSGENYADALSVSSAAAVNQYPIFIVGKAGISDLLRKEILTIKPSKVFIIGAKGAVSETVETQIAVDKGNIVRIEGANRFETSLAVAEYFKLPGSISCIATGNDFPDALAGSVYAAKNNAPIILVDKALTDSERTYLQNGKISGATVFGGEGVVNNSIEQQVNTVIGSR